MRQKENMFVTVYRKGYIGQHFAVRTNKSFEEANSYIQEKTSGFTKPDFDDESIEIIDLSKGYIFTQQYNIETDVKLTLIQKKADDWFEVHELDEKELGLKAGCYWILDEQYLYHESFYEEDLDNLFPCF